MHPRKVHLSAEKKDEEYNVWWKKSGREKKLSEKTYSNDAKDLLCHLNIICDRNVGRAAAVLQRIIRDKIFDDCREKTLFLEKKDINKQIVDNISNCIQHHNSVSSRKRSVQTGVSLVRSAVPAGK